MQHWKKLGCIYDPAEDRPWKVSHAAVPIAEHISGDLFRIYFSSRDALNRSYTCWVEVDLRDPGHAIRESSQPVLSPGSLGEFDDSGAMGTWIARHDGTRYLYYIGWNLGVTVPFRNSIGLSVARGDDEFRRFAPGPIVDRSPTEPHFTASCCVIPGDDVWRMWYLSCTEWRMGPDGPQHRYHVKYAESDNGIDWRRDGTVAIDYANDQETAISRPTVIRDDGVWKMWYSFRGPSYRIGYAESTDARHWVRKDDEVGMGLSAEGWDSQMIEYPFVFDHDGKRYMLYNGNDFGRTGFGLAMLQG